MTKKELQKEYDDLYRLFHRLLLTKGRTIQHGEKVWTKEIIVTQRDLDELEAYKEEEEGS